MSQSRSDDPTGADTELIGEIRAGLRALADAEKAPQMQAYMKSEMPYLGVQTPAHRKLCRELLRRYRRIRVLPPQGHRLGPARARQERL